MMKAHDTDYGHKAAAGCHCGALSDSSMPPGLFWLIVSSGNKESMNRLNMQFNKCDIWYTGPRCSGTLKLVFLQKIY